jgi:hypothetical protein
MANGASTAAGAIVSHLEMENGSRKGSSRVRMLPSGLTVAIRISRALLIA